MVDDCMKFLVDAMLSKDIGTVSVVDEVDQENEKIDV
ncbi:hypothetical protein X975_04799, partial [Stegodyphus mimosarum]